MKRLGTPSWTIKSSKYLQYKVLFILYSLKSPSDRLHGLYGGLWTSYLLLLWVNVFWYIWQLYKSSFWGKRTKTIKSQQLIFNKMTAFCFHAGVEVLLWCCIWSCRRCGWAFPGRTGSTRPCRWRWSSPYTAGTAMSPSLVEREMETSQEKPTVCTRKGFLKGELSALTNSAVVAAISQVGLKFCRLQSAWLGGHNHDDKYGLEKDKVLLVVFFFWASEIVDRNEGWRFGSYQVMEGKDSKTSKGALLDPRLSLRDRERVATVLWKVVTLVTPWQRSGTLPYCL